MRKRSTLSPEETLALILKDDGVYRFNREFRFHAQRRWRIDFIVYTKESWHVQPTVNLAQVNLRSPTEGLLVEIEGITPEGGRHQRMAGFEGDCEKYAEALIMGYAVLRVTPKMVRDGRALDYINRYFTHERSA